MYGNFSDLNKELKNKKVNTINIDNHIIFSEMAFSSKKLKKAYEELKSFDYASFDDFLRYEKWLEDCTSGDKKR